MRRILVAVDGSAPSLEGVKAAATLAKALSGRLELVNVLPPVLLAPTVYAEAIRKVEEGQRLAAQEAFAKARQLIPAELPVSETILTGPPAEALADSARNDEVWGVVIGAKGHSAVSRVLLGSVTDRLVHICSKPVLVVR